MSLLKGPQRKGHQIFYFFFSVGQPTYFSLVSFLERTKPLWLAKSKQMHFVTGTQHEKFQSDWLAWQSHKCLNIKSRSRRHWLLNDMQPYRVEERIDSPSPL